MDFEEVGTFDRKVPDLTQSASMKDDGTVTVTLNNLSLTDDNEVKIALGGKKIVSMTGELLDAEADAYNDFDQEEDVTPVAFTDFELKDGEAIVKIPASSVLALNLTIA